MFVETIEGSGLIVVNDECTGLKLDSKISYSISCTVNVIDEKAYSYATASKSLKEVLNNFIGVCSDASFREAYPNGVEYEELTNGMQKVNDIIKNNVSDILECNGIAIESLSVDNIILDEGVKNMIEKMRKMKAVMNSTVPNTSVEWICSCGNKNTGNFCTECGSPRVK